MKLESSFTRDSLMTSFLSSKETILNYIFGWMDIVNALDPWIKFTINHTSKTKCDHCDDDAKDKIPFLDTQVEIKNNKIITDLYKKPTDRNMYLLPSSCHVTSVCDNIPYSLCLRIIRICSEPEARDLRLAEL